MKIQREAATSACSTPRRTLRQDEAGARGPAEPAPHRGRVDRPAGDRSSTTRPPPPVLDELKQIALAVRPDLVAFRLGIQRAEADVRARPGQSLLRRLRALPALHVPEQHAVRPEEPDLLGPRRDRPPADLQPQPGRDPARQAERDPDPDRARDRSSGRRSPRSRSPRRSTRSRGRRSSGSRRSSCPTAVQVRDDTYRLYIGGEVNVVVFLNAQKDYNDIVKQYLDTVVRHRRSMLALNTALGQRVLP